MYSLHKDPKPGRRVADGPPMAFGQKAWWDEYNIMIGYLGVWPYDIPDIMANGLRPTFGLGSDQCRAHFGSQVAGVLVGGRL